VRRHVAASSIAEAVTAGLALLGAVVTGDTALVALAAPLALAAVLGLSSSPPQLPHVEVSVDPLLVPSGSPFTVEVAATSATPQLCSLELCLPPAMIADGPCRWAVFLRPGAVERWTVTVTAMRPGRFSLGEVEVRSEAAASGASASGRAGRPVPVEVRPDRVRLKELVRSERVRAQAGDRVGRLAADGIEFAEVREQAAGAMERRINWRVSARRGTTCVNLHHPERNTDVVLLADTFSRSTLPEVIRISANLADAYLRRHDRVGLVCFGGVMDWVEPGSGPAHAERILGALLSSDTYLSYAWKSADLIPRRLIPPGCLVLAVSPLTDERFVGALADLRSRGLDVAIVELAPDWPESPTHAGDLATRILRMEREALRQAFWGMGMALASVEPSDSADVALARLVAVRRALRRRAPA
jgi:uncharacterized protein (DUF58 family)